MKIPRLCFIAFALIAGCSSPAEQEAARFEAEMAKLRSMTDQISRQDALFAQVAADAVDRYEIAKRQGNKIQICVQAGVVSASYLQAKDEPAYNHWKQVEASDCARAGLRM